ncbi:hypothetical protein [Leifsonella bigeumensis]|uniref:hypothetical protein n=1 Tax=Leifsonella bigeumensis TaxID=433643 RepID=UPI0031E2A3F1
MVIPIPTGVVQVRSLTTDEILYGDRETSYRWEVLTHSDGTDHLAGYLDGVIKQSAKFGQSLYAPTVKGNGHLRVADLAVAQPGFMTLREVTLTSARLRPVLVIEGLPEIPLGVFLFAAAPEDWSGSGKVVSLELLDRATVLDQDQVDASYTVDTSTGILAAVSAVISSAGESITIDAEVTTALSSSMVWPAGTTKLQIVNDLLDALGYDSLRVDGVGQFQANPYVLPANRSLTYELLNLPRELVDGETSIYSEEWSRDVDMFSVPNKVIAVQAGSGDAPALVGEYTNTDSNSPFSYPSRGRWITRTLDNVDTPDGTDAEVIAFLESKAQQSLIAASAVQAAVTVRCLPIPVRVGDVLRFANTPAGIDARHVVTRIELEANSLGLMRLELQEVVSL